MGAIEALVPKDRLNVANISPVLQHLSCHGMAEEMALQRADLLFY